MARIRVTPRFDSGAEPFELSGELTKKRIPHQSILDGITLYSTIYYINDASFPAEIVTVLEE